MLRLCTEDVCWAVQDGGFNAYDFKAEDEEEDADMEKLKALAGAGGPPLLLTASAVQLSGAASTEQATRARSSCSCGSALWLHLCLAGPQQLASSSLSTRKGSRSVEQL